VIILRSAGKILCATLFACTTIASVHAQERIEELSRFDFDVEYLAVQRALEQVNSTDVAKENNLPLPIMPPRLLADQVEARIDSRVQELAEEQYPEARKEEIIMEVNTKLKMWKVGDYIQFHGIIRGIEQMVEGQLLSISMDRIRIGDINYARKDLRPWALAKIYKPEHEEMRRKHIGIQTRNLEMDKKKFMKELHSKMSNEEWPRYGYVFSKRKHRWIPADSVLQLRLKKKIVDTVAANREDARNEIYEQKGCVRDPFSGNWSIGGEGVKSTESMLRRVRRFFRGK
jgi:hypothetical protein